MVDPGPRRRGCHGGRGLPGCRLDPVHQGEVQGLTTGAGMWLAGAVGLSCGFGLWQIAGLGTFLILVVMGLLHSFEVRLGIAADKKEHGGKDKEPPEGRQEGRHPRPVLNSTAMGRSLSSFLMLRHGGRPARRRPDVAAGARTRHGPGAAPASTAADAGPASGGQRRGEGSQDRLRRA